SIEWVNKLRESPDARREIDSAKGWNLKINDPHLAKELEAGTLTEKVLSCVTGKWDGDDPPGDRGAFCRSVLERKVNAIAATTTSELESEILGIAANLAMPLVGLKFTGIFWEVHGKYHVLEGLAASIGSDSGHYSFAQKYRTWG